jgi:predicted MFS family arabinose efflux permease
MPNPSNAPTFTRYQKFVIALLAFLQFTIILDFMILSPLGALLLRDLNITTAQFGLVVSAYAFSAGIAGMLTAGFADKFDRKKLLLFFYAGFVLGTALCAVAPNYPFLLGARIVTGLFGGVIGSIGFAIVTDLFPLEVRGRVMGTVQTAFAAAQVLGLPVGLLLSNHLGWHAPFAAIAALSALVGVVIVLRLQPLTAHLAIRSQRSPVRHLLKTISDRRYLQAFGATMLLATGGFMLMPFGSAFTVNNLGIPITKLPLIYVITGVCSIVSGPLLGRLADQVGKYIVFVSGSVLSAIVVGIYCNLGTTPIAWVIAINAVLFSAIMARMIAAGALTSAVPDPQDRGAFMAVGSSLQQLSGGVASSIAGMIVFQTATGHIERYDTLGWVVIGAITLTVLMMYPIHRMALARLARPTPPLPQPVAAE